MGSDLPLFSSRLLLLLPSLLQEFFDYFLYDDQQYGAEYRVKNVLDRFFHVAVYLPEI